MASPRTRRVLKELKVKDGNNVSIFVVLVHLGEMAKIKNGLRVLMAIGFINFMLIDSGNLRVFKMGKL